MKKAVVIVLILSAAAGLLFWQSSANLFSKPQPKDENISLTYWGMLDEEGAIRPAIATYEQTHPRVKIAYVKQSALNYRTRLQTQIQAGQGPDVFRLHSSWLSLFLSDLYPAPEKILPMEDFNKTFYPLAKDTLTSGGKIYALPKEIDGLALYINDDILKAAGATVPVTWQEFIDTAKLMTVRDAAGGIQTAGAAMGTAANVDFWPEILGILFLQQPGGSLVAPANKDGAEVLQFYTGFVVDPRNKTWDVTLPSSTQMFTEGKLAFYFAPASQAPALLAANPDLHFKTAPVPQLPGKKVSYGSFWAMAVSGRSAHTKEAWEFAKYLVTAETLQIIAQQQTQTQVFTRPYPRVDLAGLQVADPVLGAFLTQAPYYKSWYLNSGTGDAGLNEEMIKLYEEAVNDVLQGKDALGTLQVIGPEIQKVLDKYKIKQ